MSLSFREEYEAQFLPSKDQLFRHCFDEINPKLFERILATFAKPLLCNCHIDTLMSRGCQCGGK